MRVTLAKTPGVLSFTPLTMYRSTSQIVDFKVRRHFGEGQPPEIVRWLSSAHG